MYQESDDRIRGGGRSDVLLFVILIVAFFAIGAIATYLRSHFDNNNLPIYVFAALCAVAVYLIYRLRILGYRYTVFFKEPEIEYDPRFDDYMKHEDYPYPVGTFVAERTSSAKGTIIAVVNRENIKAFLEPGEEYCPVDEEIVCACHKKAKDHSLVYTEEGRTVRMYIRASEELAGHIREIMENNTAEAGVED